MTSTISNWHVVRTEPNAEEKADQSLRMSNYATFLPYELVNVRRPVRGQPGKFQIGWEKKPLYPRYLFIGVQPGQGLYQATKANGVASILHCDGEPAKVPHKVMDALMMQADAGGIVDRRSAIYTRKPFVAGQLVRAGVSSAFSGINFEIETDNGDVIIALGELFGRMVPVEFKPGQVTAI